MLYGELGRTPLKIIIAQRIIGFGAPIATNISHLLLNYIIRDSIENGNSYSWLDNLISLFNNLGMSNIYIYIRQNIFQRLKYFFKILNERQRERNVLFNDALNTFYLRLYGVRHMVKDHSDSEKGNPLSPHRLFLSINSKGSFICTIPQTG